MPTDEDANATERPRQNDTSAAAPAQVDRGMHHASRKLRCLIAARLRKPAMQVSQVDIEQFISEFATFCDATLGIQMGRRTITHWFSKDDTTIYKNHRQHVLDFFRQTLPNLTDALLSVDWRACCEELERQQRARSQTVVIELPVPLGSLTTEDRNFLCGVYELYRYSFANDNEINIDLLIVTPDKTQPNRLRIEIIVEPLNKGEPNETFVGYLYTYGHTLLGVPILANPDPSLARARRFEFPAEDLTRTREHLIKIGIVAGNSVQLDCPVAAKCLISKLSNTQALLEEYVKIVNRYPAAKLYAPYVEAISNDIRRHPDRTSEQDDALLHVKSVRKPKVRPRSTFPVLPLDPDDPHVTRL